MRPIKYRDKLVKKIRIFTLIIITFVSSTFYFLERQITKDILFIGVIGYVIVSFILMILDNKSEKRLSSSLHKMKENELKLSLYVLQSQMNSHFWYNMLGMISLESQLKNYSKITKACTELSKMLSFTSTMGDGFCSLEDELIYTKNYMNIMKMRYENYLEYQIDIPEDMKCIRIPKNVVQPICENAFIHAFKDNKSIWKIHIRCYKTDKQWYIVISDNGSGINDEIINKINLMKKIITVDNAMIQMEKLEFGGLTFPNVYLRLLLTYFDKMVFEVKNTENGASIILGGEIE